MDLRTSYLGLNLHSPLVPSASPLSRDLDMARRLEDAGAGALVMHSLFEEELRREEEQMARFLDHQALGHAEAESFLPAPVNYTSTLEEYLEHLAALKRSLAIPVIASLNGISHAGWIEHGRELQDAGADALELNVYYVAADLTEDGAAVEDRYVELLRALRGAVDIPITVKLSSQFSAPGHLIQRLEAAGADGVALFNRFYQPDIDLETLQVVPHLQLSTSAESRLRVRWIAILYGRVNLSLAATGGVHTAEDALKVLLAGADVAHLCSALLHHGPEQLRLIEADMVRWLEEHEYDSVSQLKGSVSHQHAPDPAGFERANYLQVLDSYSPARGVRR
ncbi:MAG TPA: dihydroorotate dehydrogenase-like protein [Gammaproteobacteria bacterium]|nr:dihydroorotate dehydrogenase-like protein [Gammaproteobacteria bacterium]